MKKAVPDAFICGFTKCATSSLYDWIIQHPKVSGGVRKELEFLYDKDGSSFFRSECNYHDHGLEGYENLFSRNIENDALLVDATPAYVYHKTARQVISSMQNSPQVILVKRDPVDQIVSTYYYFSNNKQYIPKSVSLEKFLEHVISGKCSEIYYHDHLRNALDWACFDYWIHLWRRDVGENSVHVFDMSDVVKRPQETCSAVFKILGVEDFRNIEFIKGNETYYVKNRSLQSLNAFIRNLIPRGALYNAGRAIYRAVNTNSEKPGESGTIISLKREVSDVVNHRQTLLLKNSSDVSYAYR